MNVKEMIEKINYRKTWMYLYDDFFKRRNYPSDKLEYFKREISNAVALLKKMEPVVDNDWIVVIGRYLEDNMPPYSEYISSDLHKKSEIKEQFKIDKIIEGNTDVSTWTKEQLTWYFKNKPFITTWGFEFSDWNEVLGFDIWDGSIREFSLERCAAAVLYEMTYCGFTPEEVKRKNEEIFGKKDSPAEEHELEEDDSDALLEPDRNLDEVFTEELKISFENWKTQYARLKKLYEELTKE